MISARSLAFILISFITATSIFAQSEPETAQPLFDAEVIRKVSLLDIEGEWYKNVTISFKSNDDVLNSKVKIKVIDKNGNIIYKRTFKKSFLYIFSKGQIQIGRPKFNQIIIYKSESYSNNTGIIREKEGVYLHHFDL